jgi:predicted Fe-Mo cluster-binding NifX family protein
MKIAAVSDDGKTISQHFGRATQYIVVTTEGNKVISKEIRQKAGHAQFASQGHHEEHGCGCHEVHGHQEGSQERHGAMAQSILDAKVLLAGGMGWGAYESLKSYNIEPVITDVKDIEQAVKLYLDAKLPNLMQKLH